MIKNIFDILMLILLVIYCLYVIFYEKRSIKSDLIEKGVKFSRYKTIVSNEQIYDKHIQRLMKSEEKKYELPKIKFKNKIEIKKYLDMSYVIINKNSNHKKIFYLHGGSFIENPLFFHYKFLDNLASSTNLEIIMPIYPKAPKYNYKNSYEKVYELYKKLFDETNNIILMGDSAGGGFCLTLSMLIRDNGGIKPSNIILLSPWLDVRMKNKNIKTYEKKDPFLSKNALIKAGVLWSNNEDNWMVNPIEGNFENLGLITIFVGTHEILFPDIKKFKNILKRNKKPYNFYEYKKMNHVFPLFPIPEAKKAQKTIISIIKK